MTQADYLRTHAMTPSEGCRVWPFFKDKDGYGTLWFDGRQQRVNVVTCLLWHGVPPLPKMDAAHTCHNRECWAGEHLTWKSRRDNLADRYGQGTSPRGTNNPNTKLTENDVRIIRARLAAGDVRAHIARDYGVDTTTIRDIKTGKAWAWLDNDERTEQ